MSKGQKHARQPVSRNTRNQPQGPRGNQGAMRQPRDPHQYSPHATQQFPSDTPRFGRSDADVSRYEDQRALFDKPKAGGRGKPQTARGNAPQQQPRQGGKPGNPQQQPRSAQGNPQQQQPAARAAKPQAEQGPKVARAKKMLVREGSQKEQERNRQLRDTRVDLENIEPMRLQKALSASGIGSRREMEAWIEQGLVEINGKVASLGDKVGPQDRVTVKGSAVKLKWADRLPRVIVYHKQEGEIVSRDDPEGRVTVFDRLPQAKSSRWVAIGRLDVNTSGLLILTTSGELVNRLAHPSFEVEREYAVRVLGELTREQLQEMTKEVMLEDGPAHFERISEQGGEGANHWYRVVIKEGRNREVRRMFEHFGVSVSRLMRVRFGAVSMPARLKRGQFYELNETEVAGLLKWAGMGLNSRPGSSGTGGRRRRGGARRKPGGGEGQSSAPQASED